MTDALKVELAERIAAKRVLVVVGTGVSLAATGGEKLASWKGLIASGVDRLVELGLRDAKWATSQKELLEGDLDDLLGVAEQVSRRLGWERTDDRCGGDWNKWLRTTVGGLRTTHPELIEVIRDLGAPLATLNYDNLLTEVTGRRPLTWQRAERWLPVLEGEDEAVLHLHGHWDQPSSVVLGIRAYDAMLGQDLAQHVQRALASFQSLAFIGCGATLEDPNFGALLAWMREQLTGLEHSHYLLLREGETLSVPEPQLREARIVPLRYGRTHTDLLPYLHDLLPEPTGPTPDPRIGRSKPSPPSVPPIDRRAYAEQARKRYDVLDLTALTQAGSVDPEAPPPRLSRLFVPPHARRSRPPQSLPRDYLLSQGLDPDDEERARDLLRAHWERTERGPVLDLIGQDRARCAVVLGDPGAGKSSLVRYLLLRLLEFPATDADAAAAAWRRPLEGRLPFLVELRDLIAREAEGKCADFLSYLAYLGERQGLGFARAQLEHALGNGPTLVVFDGLDEIFEVKPRSRIANEIIGFAARWPSARVLVTSRIAGFHAHPFEAAGFAVLTLDDLDDAQVRVFATAWFELVFPGQPREAERAWQDRLETLTHRPNLRVLAGNPLLLTIMAVVARHERLARSRAKLYEQALKVLCYGYAVAEADLHHALEGYFLDHWGFERATQRRAAREMIELLETRNWILTLRGPRLYGFVHRTFLEYLCAAELVRRFQDRELEFEELRDRHVLGHVEDDAWHEVIRLLVALLPLKQAEEIVRVLTPAPERAKEREACLVLAFQCLAEREGRELGRLAEACDRLMDALYAWLPQLGGYDHWEREQRLSRTVAQSLQAIGSGWPDMALLEKRGLPSCGGIYDDRYLDPFVALVGLFADLPATRELLTSRTLAEEGSARGSALRALAAHFRDDPETAPLLRRRAVEDEDGGVRGTALDALARHFRDDPETAPLLRHQP